MHNLFYAILSNDTDFVKCQNLIRKNSDNVN